VKECRRGAGQRLIFNAPIASSKEERSTTGDLPPRFGCRPQREDGMHAENSLHSNWLQYFYKQDGD
jgi:hypothetical protein